MASGPLMYSSGQWLSDHVIHLGDCLEGMAALADKSVDHTICDPPFASEIYERCKKNPGRHTDAKRGAGSSISLGKLANGVIGTLDAVLDDAAAQIARVTRRWALVFCDAESVHLWREALERHGMGHIRVNAWIKKDPMPQFSGDRPAQGFEAAELASNDPGDLRMAELAYGSGRPKWNAGGKAGLWFYGVCKGDERPEHPCPKPLAMMEEIVRDYSDPGELVCDPFAGSGTTGVACKRLGRRFIGWEKDEVFWGRAVRRLEETRQQYELLPRPPKAKQTRLLP